MKKGGRGCAVPVQNGECSKYVLESSIEPTKHTVFDTLQRDYSSPGYEMPNIGHIDTSYSSFGSLTGGGKKINKKVIEKVLKKLSSKYVKNLSTNIREVIKKELK
jgi:hypothetical protein